MNVLICEDNVIIALELEITIEAMGHAVSGHVTRSDDCVAQCEANPPDLVIVDLDLDDGPTGAALTKTLADMGIPSVIVSGQTGTLRPEDHAALRVIGKPADAAELKAALDAYA